jgi:hypothetical protein
MPAIIAICEVCPCTCDAPFGQHGLKCAKRFEAAGPWARCWTHHDVIAVATRVPDGKGKSVLSSYWTTYYAKGS